ncbi:MAG: acyltransferase [Gemmataceae bacterium]|nr:acyltransferase [Gemmataceae bacterium]
MAASYQTPRNLAAVKQRLAFLDVARAVAALLVFAEHILDRVIPGYRLWTATHFYPGRIGVLIFLVVSGFIIPVSLEQGGSNARFWVRRFFRLFPLYWLTILIAYLLSRSGAYEAFEPRVWLLNLTMLQGMFKCPHVVGLFWTLQLELVIYVACSVLFALRLLNRPVWIAGLILVGFTGLGTIRPLLTNQPFDVGGQRWLYFAPVIGLVAQRYWAGRLGRGPLAAVVLGQFLVIGSVWTINSALFPGAVSERVLDETAWTWGLAYACFFGLLAIRQWRMPAPAAWMGRISYSVYLLHPLVLAVAFSSGWTGWLVMLMAFAATLLLAQVTFRLVEKPGITLGRIVEDRWLPAPVPPQPARPALRQAA